MIKDIKYWFKRKREQVNQVLYYLPTIWNSYDWDFTYMEELLYLKLAKFEEKFRYRVEPWQQIYNPDFYKGYKALRICLIILKRRKSGNYWYFQENIKNLNYTEIDKIKRRDWSILCDLLKKYEATWWD